MKIMKLVLINFLLILSQTGIAQENSHLTCSKYKSTHTPQLKSNTLTISQIQETEKYDVHFYFLDLNMTNLTTTLSGTVEMQATALESIDSILIELYASMNITDVRFNGVSTPFNRNSTAVKVPANINVNAAFSVQIDYNGTPPTAATNPLGGSGMSNSSSPTWGNQVTWSLSEPFSAYEWFPCKQSLKDKIDSTKTHITVPTACKAGSNGVLENIVDLGNGTHRFEWKHNHPIDYYLMSVAVAQYVDYTIYAHPAGTTDSVMIQNYIYDNPSTLTYFQSDIDETVDFVELFSDIFGMYPFINEKYGHCMAPLGGGMEHQTMTTQGTFSKGLTAHELAHQWWGNSVTCASWADIWVNEGFASYSENLMLENLYPNEAFSNMENRHASVMSQSSGSVYVLDSLNEGRIFSGRLTYNKGAAILHTMRYFMDNDTLFFETLREFQTLYKNGTAYGLDFKALLEANSGLDFTQLFEEWYFGEGYPTYTVKWNHNENGTFLNVSQTTSAPSITPLFTTPLEVRFSRLNAADTTIRLEISALEHYFEFQNLGDITSVNGVDPNNWIINPEGIMIYDPELKVEEITTEFQGSNEMKLFPIPTNDFVQIEAPEAGMNSLILYDNKGKKVFDSNFETSYILDLTRFNSGNYLIELQTAKGNTQRRIIIKE